MLKLPLRKLLCNNTMSKINTEDICDIMLTRYRLFNADWESEKTLWLLKINKTNDKQHILVSNSNSSLQAIISSTFAQCSVKSCVNRVFWISVLTLLGLPTSN